MGDGIRISCFELLFWIELFCYWLNKCVKIYNSCSSHSARIEDAHWSLRSTVRKNTPKITSKTPGVANTELVNGLKKSTIKSPDEETGNPPPPLGKDLLKIVSFEKGNFVQSWRAPRDTYYHAILW